MRKSRSICLIERTVPKGIVETSNIFDEKPSGRAHYPMKYAPFG
jgi:hypothetical protein